jgi:putative tryptophan/tyrosine transport system substrate-binding protein
VKRRPLAAWLAAALAGGPGAMLRAPAQTAGKVPRIGVLRFGVPGDEAQAGLTGGLAAIGYHDGRTIQIEWRWATRADVAQRAAAELAGMGLDLLVASATPAAVALRDVNPSVPIIMATAADPVGAGLVASLARPGGNITGVSTNLPAMVPKQLQLLLEVVPGLQRVAFLGSTEDKATPLFVEQAESAARMLGIKLQPVLIGQASEFDRAVDAMVRERAQAVVVQPLFTLGHSAPLAQVLARRKLPSTSGLRQFALAGGLMTYGPNRVYLWQRSASFIDRVLKGAKPASLPVEEPTVFELTFNLQTARRIDLAIPQSLLLRADEVIR